MNDMTLRAHALYLTARDALAARAAEEDGQTAAEYLGIVVVVALIIGAIFSSGIDTTIAGHLTDLVDRIFAGGG